MESMVYKTNTESKNHHRKYAEENGELENDTNTHTAAAAATIIKMKTTTAHEKKLKRDRKYDKKNVSNRDRAQQCSQSVSS